MSCRTRRRIFDQTTTSPSVYLEGEGGGKLIGPLRKLGGPPEGFEEPLKSFKGLQTGLGGPLTCQRACIHEERQTDG